MIRIFRSLTLGVVFGLLIMLRTGTAQQPPGTGETGTANSYHPGLGELMTAFVQPRHIKLGLAGGEHNWPYAAYELGELSESFDDIAGLVPKHDNMPIPEMIASTVKPPMAALARAIKSADPAAFAAAYGELSAACNACHRSAGHPVIVIRVPTTSPFPDQDFRPQR
jgi:hypothetical protein